MAPHECDGVIRLDTARWHAGWRREARARGPGWVGRVRDMLRLVWHVRRTRRQLAEMDDRMLADIGIGRADAYEETRRAPWDMGVRPR